MSRRVGIPSRAGDGRPNYWAACGCMAGSPVRRHRSRDRETGSADGDPATTSSAWTFRVARRVRDERRYSRNNQAVYRTAVRDGVPERRAASRRPLKTAMYDAFGRPHASFSPSIESSRSRRTSRRRPTSTRYGTLGTFERGVIVREEVDVVRNAVGAYEIATVRALRSHGCGLSGVADRSLPSSAGAGEDPAGPAS